MLGKFGIIRKLISKAEFEEALNELEGLASLTGKENLINGVVHLSSSYYYLKGEHRKGIREIDAGLNKFIDGLLDILKSIEKDESFKDASKEIEFNLAKRMSDSKQIDLLCYSCVGVFDDYNYHIKSAVMNGANVRVLFIKPESDAYKLMLAHTKWASMEGDIIKIQKRIHLLEGSLKEAGLAVKGRFEYRFINWIPSINIFLFDRDFDTGVVSVKINPVFYATPMKERLPSEVYYRQINSTEFDYYHIQYEHLWLFHDSTKEGFKDSLEYLGKDIFHK